MKPKNVSWAMYIDKKFLKNQKGEVVFEKDNIKIIKKRRNSLTQFYLYEIYKDNQKIDVTRSRYNAEFIARKLL